MQGKVSKHFTWGEFLFSQTAKNKGIANIPTPFAAGNLVRVSLLALEPTRTHFARPAKVTSGYRGPKLNAAIGGSTTSNHCIGCAIDFEILNVDNYEVAKWMSENLRTWDEIILEAYEPGKPNSGWIHVAMRPENNRKKVLTWNRKDGYRQGLIR